MGSIPSELAAELRDGLGLRRGVETGTYRGDGARALAGIFESAVTIELSKGLWEDARRRHGDVPNLELRHGHSAELLGEVVDRQVPTFYFLDGHWSGGSTAGEDDECPVLGELAAIAAGHPDDCIAIDDARLFAAPPPPPHDPGQWPTLLEVIDAIRATHPGHHITILSDLVIAVPARAKPVVDRFGQRPASPPPSKLRQLATALTGRLRRGRL